MGATMAGFINLTIYETAIQTYEANNGIVRGTDASIKSASTFGDYYMLSPYVTSWNNALFIEGFGTAFLVFCVLALTHKKNKIMNSTKAIVPFLIGAVYAVLFVMLRPLTGAAINPGM